MQQSAHVLTADQWNVSPSASSILFNIENDVGYTKTIAIENGVTVYINKCFVFCILLI